MGPQAKTLTSAIHPEGYTTDREERRATIAALLAEAERRPLVVLCDDAYAGLVFEPEIPLESLFWELARAHPNLAAVKIDGATKEFLLLRRPGCWCAPGWTRRRRPVR